MKIPVVPPKLHEIANRVSAKGKGVDRYPRLLEASRLGPAPGGYYRHWDTFRHLAPPAGFTAEEAWFGIKTARRSLYQEVPLKDAHGKPFHYAVPSPLLEMLHRIDRDAAGNIQGSDQVVNPATRSTYLFKSLVEEAITSSQLEGAATTRKVAKAMIQEGREPRTTGERMIFNNYRAMLAVRDIRNEELTPELVFALQQIVTEGTLDDESAAGRFRRADEEIVLEDETGTILHTPPPSAQLKERLRRMCEFANGGGTKDFMPPAIRAIILHFWLAYDHPFVDGNGRTARALFYWAMARQGFWLCEYISISRILKKARAAYARAYLYTETDENDLTYFILYQARVLLNAIGDLQDYLQRKAAEVREAEELVSQARAVRQDLNPRQLALLNHALKTPAGRYTIESHQRSHGVSYQTARSDLLSLRDSGILAQRKTGRAFVFEAPVDLRARLSRT
ncbi:MAG TPA: Fic family protein [Gemmatimonadaceae bacterium]|nr:Fic family protein [Gemmatimonadaceae bacterium]